MSPGPRGRAGLAEFSGDGLRFRGGPLPAPGKLGITWEWGGAGEGLVLGGPPPRRSEIPSYWLCEPMLLGPVPTTPQLP